MSQTRSYACWFPRLIEYFRAQFEQPTLWFGWVQLSTWCIGASRQIAEMRQAQLLSAANLSNVGWASHGPLCH